MSKVEDVWARMEAGAEDFAAEQARINAVRSLGAVPQGFGSEIIDAPARGPLSPFREGYWHDADGATEWRDVPYRSGCPGKTRDIFDTMTDQGARRGGGVPFTSGQVGAGRDYCALYERIQSAGVKCSNVFDVQARSCGNTDFMTAYIRDTERLRRFWSAIGDGVAKDTKRQVPAMKGGLKIGDVQLRQIGRKLITVRRLVDDVCIGGRSLSNILEAHNWRATGKNRKSLRDALCTALDRMQGV